jgi:hypothetical protein
MGLLIMLTNFLILSGHVDCPVHKSDCLDSVVDSQDAGLHCRAFANFSVVVR